MLGALNDLGPNLGKMVHNINSLRPGSCWKKAEFHKRFKVAIYSTGLAKVPKMRAHRTTHIARASIFLSPVKIGEFRRVAFYKCDKKVRWHVNKNAIAFLLFGHSMHTVEW